MLRYLKEAFWVRQRVPLLGDVPVNALAVAGAVILGFAQPAIWLLALALETAFLWALSSSPRFRKLVNAPRDTSNLMRLERKRQALVRQLPPDDAVKLRDLEEKEARIRQFYQDFGFEDFSATTNLENLEKLRWMYLKLLTAQRHLLALHRENRVSDLEERMKEIQTELADQSMADGLRESRERTLDILKERLKTHRNREESLAQIESDLYRIESQFDLALEKAALKSRPGEMSFNLDLASQLFDSDEYFGSSSSLVTELDEGFAQQTISES